jgi:hypothetical protein
MISQEEYNKIHNTPAGNLKTVLFPECGSTCSAVAYFGVCEHKFDLKTGELKKEIYG